MMKYYSIFHELVTFKYEVKLDLLKESIKKNQENLNVYLLLSLKGLGYFNINSIMIRIVLKANDEKYLKDKMVEIDLKENEKISFTKAFIFKLTSKEEKKEMKVEIEIFYIFKESLKFRFVSVAKKINN
jgi:hypothetical protein